MTFSQKCIVTITVCGISCITFISLSFKEPPPTKQKIILAIFAHPDDEGAIGTVLAKYAKSHKVYIVIATDGRYGIRDHAGIPEGDSLAAVVTGKINPDKDLSSFPVNEIVVEILSAAKESAKTGKTIYLNK